MSAEHILEYSVIITMGMLAASILLVSYRVVRGPSLPDRVVALDLANVVTVGIVAVDAIATGRSSFLPAGVTLALLAFIATVAFSNYLFVRLHND